MGMTRRSFNRIAAAGAAAWVLSSGTRARAGEGKRWLLFTRSAGFEHEVVRRTGGEASFLAQTLTPLFADKGLALVESKDGRLLEPGAIAAYAGFVFYTTGDLTGASKDGGPPMSPAGRRALLDAVAGGTPFIGLHCASDTFHSPDDGDPSDFVKMLGGEFDAHGEQQVATAKIVDASFPGVGEQGDWTFNEEWYALKNLAADIRPIHVLQTAGMKGAMYEREPFPITWTRSAGRARVFYTALGHRQDVLASKAYGRLIGGAIDWCGR